MQVHQREEDIVQFFEQIKVKPELFGFRDEYVLRANAIVVEYHKVASELSTLLQDIVDVSVKYQLESPLENFNKPADLELNKMFSEYQTCQAVDGEPLLKYLHYITNIPPLITDTVIPSVKNSLPLIAEASSSVDACTDQASQVSLEIKSHTEAMNAKEQKLQKAEEVLKAKLSQDLQEVDWTLPLEAKTALESKHLKEIEELRNSIQEGLDSLEAKKPELEALLESQADVNKKTAEAKDLLETRLNTAVETFKDVYRQANAKAMGTPEDLLNLRREIINKVFEEPRDLARDVDPLIKKFVNKDIRITVSTAYRYTKTDELLSWLKRKMHFKESSETFRSLALRGFKGEDTPEINDFMRLAATCIRQELPAAKNTIIDRIRSALPHLTETELKYATVQYAKFRREAFIEMLETRRFEKNKLDTAKINYLTVDILTVDARNLS